MSAETWWKSWRRNEVTEKHTCCWQNCSVRSECLSIVPSPLSLPSLPLLGCVCVCVCVCVGVCVLFFAFLVQETTPAWPSSVLHIKCGCPSAHWCAIFHPLTVQSGSVPALSFSVITHFRPDIVWKSRLFWQCEARKEVEKREGERERNVCGCDSSKTIGPVLLRGKGRHDRLI